MSSNVRQPLLYHFRDVDAPIRFINIAKALVSSSQDSMHGTPLTDAIDAGEYPSGLDFVRRLVLDPHQIARLNYLHDLR